MRSYEGLVEVGRGFTIGVHRASSQFYSPTTAAGQSRRSEPSVITRCSIWPTTFRCRGRESFSPSCLWDLTCSLSLHQRGRYQNPLGRGFWWNLTMSALWPPVGLLQGFPGINLPKNTLGSLHCLFQNFVLYMPEDIKTKDSAPVLKKLCHYLYCWKMKVDTLRKSFSES